MSESLVDVRKYELIFLARPELGDKEVEELLERIRSLIKGKNGKIVFEENWGKRRLMYRINKQDHGIYVVMNFTIDPAEIAEMEQSVRLDHQVMRHLLIITPENYEIRSYKEDSQLARRPLPGKVDMATMTMAQPRPMPQKWAPKKDAVAEIPTIIAQEEKSEPKKVAKPKIDKLEDIDAKLSSIIDDPDIKL